MRAGAAELLRQEHRVVARATPGVENAEVAINDATARPQHLKHAGDLDDRGLSEHLELAFGIAMRVRQRLVLLLDLFE